MWRYRLDLAWRATWPVICWCVAAPFTFVNHLFSRPNEFAGLSQTERLLVLEARKQTKIQRSNRSDTTCCLGCIIILLLLGVTGLLGPLLAIIGIGGAIGASQ